MTSKKVTYDSLEQLLLHIGFIRGYTAGSHKVYEHTPSDTIILLPPSRPDEVVDAIHLLAVRKTVVERGVLDGDEFDRLLGSAETAALSKA